MDKIFNLNKNAVLLFLGVVATLYIIYLWKQKQKSQESGYLFLDGSYFIKYPFVDSYPQY